MSRSRVDVTWALATTLIFWETLSKITNVSVSRKAKSGRLMCVLLPAGQFFERADHVVAQISDGAADESGKIRHGHRSIGRHHFPQTFERVPTARDALLPLALHDRQVAAILVHDNGRTAAEKRIARPFLSTFDAFQEIGGRAMINFGKGRDRCLIVRQNFPVERNEIALPRVPAKFVETE